MNKPERSVVFPAPVNNIDHTLGLASAKVTLIEYGDFGCPACCQAHRALKILLNRFSADLRFIFRHFPVRNAFPHAEMAAEAAESAGAQHQFWPMHDLLFEHQLHLKEKSIRTYAQSLELDMVRYDRDIDDHIYLQRIQESIQDGIRGGIRSTPAIYVNGTLHDVSFGFDHLEEAIAIEIAKHKHAITP